MYAYPVGKCFNVGIQPGLANGFTGAGRKLYVCQVVFGAEYEPGVGNMQTIREGDISYRNGRVQTIQCSFTHEVEVGEPFSIVGKIGNAGVYIHFIGGQFQVTREGGVVETAEAFVEQFNVIVDLPCFYVERKILVADTLFGFLDVGRVIAVKKDLEGFRQFQYFEIAGDVSLEFVGLHRQHFLFIHQERPNDQRIEGEPGAVVPEGGIVHFGGTEEIIDVVTGEVQVEVSRQGEVLPGIMQLAEIGFFEQGRKIEFGLVAQEAHGTFQVGDLEVGVVHVEMTREQVLYKGSVQCNVLVRVTGIIQFVHGSVEIGVEVVEVEAFTFYLAAESDIAQVFVVEETAQVESCRRQLTRIGGYIHVPQFHVDIRVHSTQSGAHVAVCHKVFDKTGEISFETDGA